MSEAKRRRVASGDSVEDSASDSLDRALRVRSDIAKGNTDAIMEAVQSGCFTRDLLIFMQSAWRRKKRKAPLTDGERALVRAMFDMRLAPNNKPIDDAALVAVVYTTKDVVLAAELCNRRAAFTQCFLQCGVAGGLDVGFFETLTRALPARCLPTGSYSSNCWKRAGVVQIRQHALGIHWGFVMGLEPAKYAPASVKDDIKLLFRRHASHHIGVHDMRLLVRHWNAGVAPNYTKPLGAVFCVHMATQSENVTLDVGRALRALCVADCPPAQEGESRAVTARWYEQTAIPDSLQGVLMWYDAIRANRCGLHVPRALDWPA